MVLLMVFTNHNILMTLFIILNTLIKHINCIQSNIIGITHTSRNSKEVVSDF